MSSQRRILASQANGARSHGPATPEGKARSARNAVHHGLVSQIVVLDAEDPEAFQVLLSGIVERFQPVDEVEMAFAEDMAAAIWRQRRIWLIEKRLMDQTIAAAPQTVPVDPLVEIVAAPPLALIRRYEAHQTRLFQTALKNLQLLRKQFLPNEPNPEIEHQQQRRTSAEAVLESIAARRPPAQATTSRGSSDERPPQSVPAGEYNHGHV